MKRRDADSKKAERDAFKEEVKKHLRKYKGILEKNKALNRERVDHRHKNRNMLINETNKALNPQKI